MTNVLGVGWLLGSLRRIKENDITDENFTPDLSMGLRSLRREYELHYSGIVLFYSHCAIGNGQSPSAEESCPFVGLTASPVLFTECTGRSRRAWGVFAWWRGWLVALPKLGFAVASLETVVSRRRAVWALTIALNLSTTPPPQLILFRVTRYFLHAISFSLMLCPLAAECPFLCNSFLASGVLRWEGGDMVSS